MGVYTGTVPTFLAGELPDADKFTEISNFLTAATTAGTSWTPTLSNMTLGNGTVTAKYTQLGKRLFYRFKFLLGTTSSMGTDPTFTLPSGLNLHGDYVQVQDCVGDVQLRDASTGNWRGLAFRGSAANIVALFSIDTNSVLATITSTAPFTWTSTDAITCAGVVDLA